MVKKASLFLAALLALCLTGCVNLHNALSPEPEKLMEKPTAPAFTAAFGQKTLPLPARNMSRTAKPTAGRTAPDSTVCRRPAAAKPEASFIV